MTHRDAGKYAQKHPPGTLLDQRLAKAVKKKARSGKLSCAVASRLAEELGVSMADIGRTADLLEIRIHNCMLGLFGRHTATGQKRKIAKADAVSPEMERAILSSVESGRLPCARAWEIADEQGISRESVSSFCEALEIKISNCQLGAF